MPSVTHKKIIGYVRLLNVDADGNVDIEIVDAESSRSVYMKNGDTVEFMYKSELPSFPVQADLASFLAACGFKKEKS